MSFSKVTCKEVVNTISKINDYSKTALDHKSEDDKVAKCADEVARLVNLTPRMLLSAFSDINAELDADSVEEIETSLRKAEELIGTCSDPSIISAPCRLTFQDALLPVRNLLVCAHSTGHLIRTREHYLTRAEKAMGDICGRSLALRKWTEECIGANNITTEGEEKSKEWYAEGYLTESKDKLYIETTGYVEFDLTDRIDSLSSYVILAELAFITLVAFPHYPLKANHLKRICSVLDESVNFLRDCEKSLFLVGESLVPGGNYEETCNAIESQKSRVEAMSSSLRKIQSLVATSQ